MPAVTVSEFASYVQQDVDTATATLLLTLAEGLVVGVSGTIPTPASPTVKAVILEAAARAYLNPERLTSETIDDYTWRADAGSAGVYLTVDEVSRLLPAMRGGYSVSLLGPDDPTP